MYQRILVPIDGSDTSSQGLQEAIRLAGANGATVRLLHVLDELIFVTGFEAGAVYLNDVLPRLREGGQHILDEARARVSAAGVNVETALVECFGARASDIILAQAKACSADLIVVGTHGRRGIRRLMLGSDAEQVVRQATVPVLLVRASEGTAREAPSTRAEECASAADSDSRISATAVAA